MVPAPHDAAHRSPWAATRSDKCPSWWPWVELARAQYNGVRLHAGLGYVTPDDEHDGRGDAIRQARLDGLARARQARIDYRRNQRNPQP